MPDASLPIRPRQIVGVIEYLAPAPLPAALRDELEARGLEGDGREVCGYILADKTGTPFHVLQVPNIAREPEHTFVMDPMRQLEVLSSVSALELKVWAMWHSHPEGPSRPSERDDAFLPVHNMMQVIVNPLDGHAPDRVTCWWYGQVGTPVFRVIA